MQYKAGLGVLGVSLLVLVTSITGSFGWGLVEGIFGGMGLFAGVMMVLGDRPETKRAARLRHSMSDDQWDLYQGHKGSRVGLIIAGASLLVVIISVVKLHGSGAGFIWMLGIPFGGAGVLSGIVVAVVYYSEIASEWSLQRNRKVSRIGLAIASVALLVLIISVVAAKFLPERPSERETLIRVLGIVLGSAGVLGGVIVALDRYYEDRPIATGNDRMRSLLNYSGIGVIVSALGAAVGEGSWAILDVTLGLGIFELWAMFLGPGARLFSALRASIQLALFSTFLYAALNHNRNHPYFSSSWLPTQTIWEARKKLYSQPEQALQLFNAAVRYSQTPENVARAYHERGDAYITLGQTQRAISDYDQAIVLDPNDAYYYSDRGKAYQALGKAEQAQRDFDKAKELLANEAQYAIQTTIQGFDKAIRLNPKDAHIYYERGQAYAKLGQTQRSIQDFDEAIRLDPKSSLAYGPRGDAYVKLGQTERAISDYDQAIRLDPTNATYYSDRGNAYHALGNAEQAQRDFDKAKELTANQAQYAIQRSIHDFDEAIRLDPKHADGYYERGRAYAQLAQTQRAIQDFDEAIRLHPEAVYYAFRGHAYDDLGQSQRAMEDFDRAIRLDAKCAPSYDYRGLAYAKLGQTQRAILDYDQAIGLYPMYAPYYEDRGKAYKALGNAKQAQRDFDKAKELGAAK
jgi:tetratricopeptide (TPR) repeat protein